MKTVHSMNYTVHPIYNVIDWFLVSFFSLNEEFHFGSREKYSQSIFEWICFLLELVLFECVTKWPVIKFGTLCNNVCGFSSFIFTVYFPKRFTNNFFLFWFVLNLLVIRLASMWNALFILLLLSRNLFFLYFWNKRPFIFVYN